MSFKNIAVIGASGNVGNGVVPLLLQSGLKITAITREDSKSTFPQGVEVKRTDYSFESLKSHFQGQDAVLCLVATSGLKAELTVVDAAAAAGVKWFVPSELGHNTSDPRVVQLLPIFSEKVKIVDHLRSKEKDGLSWTGIHTGLFFDWGLERGTVLGFNLQNKSARLWDDGNNKVDLTNLHTIALTILHILTDPTTREEAKNKNVNISTVNTTQNEILAALEKVSATKFEVTYIKSADGKQEGQQKLAAGDSSAFLDLLQYIAFGNEELSNWDKAAEPHRLRVRGDHESVVETVNRVYEKVNKVA